MQNFQPTIKKRSKMATVKIGLGLDITYLLLLAVHSGVEDDPRDCDAFRHLEQKIYIRWSETQVRTWQYKTNNEKEKSVQP